MATFGYTTAGGTSITLGSGGATSNVIGTVGATAVYTAVGNQVVTSISVYCNSASSTPATVDLAVYTYNTGTNIPVTKVAQATLTFSNTSPQWNSVSVNIPLTAGTTYTVAMGNYVNGSAASTFYRDIPAGTNNSQGAAGALPTTWAPTTGSASLYSLYASYFPVTPNNNGGLNGLNNLNNLNLNRIV